MKRFSRIATLLVVAGALLALVVVPALLLPEWSRSDPRGPRWQAPAPTSDIEPAVPVTTPSQTEALPDWTYRYMIPAGIVLAVVVIMMTTVQYFTRVVRRRYRIVKE